MRAVIQRVKTAQVIVNEQVVSKMQSGLLIFLGIEEADNQDDINWLSAKIRGLRIFDDENGVMNKSIMDVSAQALVVSQFTLHASTKKGNRPSYIKAARPDLALLLYDQFVDQLEKVLDQKVGKGVFGAYMEVSLINDGPVTILIDTKNKE